MNPACGPPARKLSVRVAGFNSPAQIGVAEISSAVVTTARSILALIGSTPLCLFDVAFDRSRFPLPWHQQILEKLDGVAEENPNRAESDENGEYERHVEITRAAQE